MLFFLFLLQTQKLELNELLYDELVHDMEDILLESGVSLGFSFGDKIYQSYIPLPSRDGVSTASTSGTDDAYAVANDQPLNACTYIQPLFLGSKKIM